MLSDRQNSATEFVRMVEINPPPLPNMDHLRLNGHWDRVLVTDNVFGRVTVSPYAYAARITHDVPAVQPTVVVSTRDRNILAIESEVRGALGNGVRSFLVVVGDTMPAVDHQAHHYEIVEHLTALQQQMPPFEVGMPTRFRRWQLERRIELGAQFLVAGPVMDPDTIDRNVERLDLRPDDPPVYLMALAPFSTAWMDRAEAFGTVPATDRLRALVAGLPTAERRAHAWTVVDEVTRRARGAGFAGVILTGLKFDTLVGEATDRWRQEASAAG